MDRLSLRLACALLGIAWAAVLPARAAEGFQVRYNFAGTLGGEIFAPPDQQGLVMAVVLTESEITRVTGPDGQALARTVPGGTVPLPAPAPAALYPTYAPSTVEVDGSGRDTRWNLLAYYIGRDRYAGGRLAFGLNLPYVARRTQASSATGTTPTLQWSPAVPPATRSATQAQFDSRYQASLASAAGLGSGEVSGLGDIELQAAWLHSAERLRWLAGASLVLPTGDYDPATGPDVSLGRFYTLRPAVQLTWQATPEVALASRLTLGINSRNRDTDVRSGNWASLEAAAGWRTPVGVVGLHGIRMQQVQDDSNNPWGPSRFRMTTVGAFFTTRVPVIEAVLTLQYMAATASENAKHGRFSQLRLSKQF